MWESLKVKGFNKGLNIIFVGALLGAILMTWLTPRIIEFFLTPPVSFKDNCEPAAAYSMQKLIYYQIIGLVSGAIIALMIKIRFFGSKKKVVSNESSSAQ